MPVTERGCYLSRPKRRLDENTVQRGKPAKKRGQPTPGDWVFDKSLAYYETPCIRSGKTIIARPIKTPDMDDREYQANARLMTAAPKLLKALKEAMLWNDHDIEHISDITPSEDMLLCRMQVLQEAIAAAGGDA